MCDRGRCDRKNEEEDLNSVRVRDPEHLDGKREGPCENRLYVSITWESGGNPELSLQQRVFSRETGEKYFIEGVIVRHVKIR